MIILGIDPGTATTGFGAVRVDGKAVEVIEYGLVETKENGSPAGRLAEIHAKVANDVLAKIKPEVVAIERLFFATNRKTAMRVGQACGVILLAIAQAGLPVFEYTPGEIKKAIAGSGRADKAMVQKGVRKVLGGGVRKKKGGKTHFDNSADALAVALYHIYAKVSKNLW